MEPRRGDSIHVNRIKAVVLGLFAAYWVAILVLLVAARPVFDQVLDQQVRSPAG